MAHRHPLFVALSLLLASAGVASGEDEVVELPLREVELAGAVHFQVTNLRTTHELGESLRIGGLEFAVERKRGALLVAAAPGKRAARRVRGEGVFAVRLGDIRSAPKLPLWFQPSGEDAWTYRVAVAWRVQADDVQLDLLDADADGRLRFDGSDAYRLADGTSALPLGDELVVGRHILRPREIDDDRKILRAVLELVEGPPEARALLSLLNRFRVEQGLPGVTLDPELTAACTAHAEYLRTNGWTGYTNPHDQDPEKPGYSDAGREASGSSVIMKRDHAVALQAFYDSFYHRTGIVDPHLRRIGVSVGVPGISVIDTNRGREEPDQSSAFRDPILIPADGTVDVSRRFCSAGEQPEPCAAPATRGFPITALFAESDHGVTEFAATLVRLDGDRETEVEILEPRMRAYDRLFGLVPAAPLAEQTRYRATFAWTRDGKTETASTTFRTE